MSRQRWRRFLPDRSQLWIPAVAVLIFAAGAGFVNLAAARTNALGLRQEALDQRNMLREQRQALVREKERDERGDNVEQQARDLWGLGQPDETRIVAIAIATPVAQPTVVSASGGPPYWQDWWERLTQP